MSERCLRHVDKRHRADLLPTRQCGRQGRLRGDTRHSGQGPDEDEVERPRFDQLKAASSDALLFAFRRCHNYIAGNQGLQKPEAFWELLKIIFCKIHDERSSDEVELYATSKERHGLNGRLKVKKRLDRLFDEVKAEYPTIFRENEAIELNPEVLAYNRQPAADLFAP